MRRCTCGAEAEVRRSVRRRPDGVEEVIYRVSCPVCGQLGPAIPLADKTADAAIAEAIEAWDGMSERLRPI